MPRARRPKILHLEDDGDFSSLLARAFVRAGLEVDIVTVDRPEAFDSALAEGGFDLVLSDRSVHGYGGLAALSDHHRRGLEAPFVLLSGALPPEGPDAYLGAGAADVLIKDDLPGVVERVRELLVGSRPAPERPHAADPLARAIRQLARARTVADAVAILPPAARLLSGADAACVALRDGDTCRTAGEEGLPPRLPGTPRRLGESVAGRALRDGRALAVDDDLALTGEEGMRSAAAIPIGRGFPIAAIAVYWRAPHASTGRDLELLGALADVADLALERARAAALPRPEPPADTAEWEAFARLLAHDLRNQLWQVRGFAEIVDEDLDAGEPARSAVAHVLRATDDLERVIRGLTDLAAVSGLPMAPRSLDLGAAARDVLAALLADEPGRPVDSRIQADLAVTADPALLRLLLEKLLSNALRFTRGRDAVVELGPIDPPETTTTFFVRDNGVGFDPAAGARLFLPFQRIHPDLEPGGGTGLAIARRIVRRHGGELWAEGSPGRGAVFYFSLPAG